MIIYNKNSKQSLNTSVYEEGRNRSLTEENVLFLKQIFGLKVRKNGN